jgi:acyl-CoA thioesterase
MADTVKTISEIIEAYKTAPEAPLVIGDGWAQGRAVFGGLAAAIGLAGMEGLSGDKPLRSFLANFVAPMPIDGVTVAPRVMRAGKSVTQTSVDVSDDNGIVLHASAAFGAPRNGLFVPADQPFKAAPKESVPRLDSVALRLPGFLQRFDIHWSGGGIPTSGSKERTTGMWVRNREDLSAYPAIKILALADIPPPVIMCHFTMPVIASSLSWSLEFVVPAAEIKSDWFYLHYELVAGANGYSQQNGSIFDESGQLIAVSRQCMVYFEPK